MLNDFSPELNMKTVCLAANMFSRYIFRSCYSVGEVLSYYSRYEVNPAILLAFK